ncbi:MAG TPA: hypothetical protein VHI13_14500 [Candidatus Kapabacteria bacterium]|nr:hypothetical protein [Candidatus Kapabacteria bacterium]
MTTERFHTLLERLRPVGDGVHSVQIAEDEIMDLTRDQAEEVVALYGSSALMRLPAREVAFFEWLRANDPEIWDDLWGSDEEPYRVGLSYLPDLLPRGRGFLICDLVEHQNYFFTAASITQEDGSPFLDAALAIVKEEGKLTMEQAFVVEAWRAPIDQWRFAYMYNQKLPLVKQMVAWLVEEGILTLPRTEEEEEATPAPDAQ